MIMNYFNRNLKLLVLILYWVTAISPEVLPVNTSISSGIENFKFDICITEKFFNLMTFIFNYVTY